jgi:hypothetical protein
MSKVWKGIKKVFKKIGKFVKKHWKKIVAAVAIYFTAGVALSYFGSTSAFAASMPGFGTGGIFTKAAAYIGFSGPAVAGAAADAGMTLAQFAATAAELGVSSATLAEQVALKNVVWSEAGGAEIIAQGAKTLPKGTVGLSELNANLGVTETAAQSTGVGSTVSGTGSGVVSGGGPVAAGSKASFITPIVPETATQAMVKAMAASTKLQAASMFVNTVSGFAAETPEEKHERENAAAFGIGRDGTGTGWGDQGGAFANMNKRTPTPPEKSTNTGPSRFGPKGSFLSSPFETDNSGEADFLPA